MNLLTLIGKAQAYDRGITDLDFDAKCIRDSHVPLKHKGKKVCLIEATPKGYFKGTCEGTKIKITKREFDLINKKFMRGTYG